MAEETKNPVRKATDKFIEWCADDSPAARLERTIAQGVIGVAVGALSGIAGAPEWVSAVIIPVTMAILAPIQASIGSKD